MALEKAKEKKTNKQTKIKRWLLSFVHVEEEASQTQPNSDNVKVNARKSTRAKFWTFLIDCHLLFEPFSSLIYTWGIIRITIAYRMLVLLAVVVVVHVRLVTQPLLRCACWAFDNVAEETPRRC